MSERSRPSAARALLTPAAALLLVLTAGCALDPAEVPDSGATPARTIRATDPAPGATDAITDGGDTVSQLITRCLARYGLNERPTAPDGSVSETEWLAAQEAIADYDRTLTDCSAEALSTDAPAPTIAP
ncbi:hypothetical protein GTU73_14995 [Rathayibacter sp. VKM Ac-2804]|uniref:hypothetical protein n=1 Tax=unclassified Rathayibacter TaxID=2609250 RepID=UPI00132EC2FB|nr:MULTISPECIES: hypothetical protein [unclassified Rathayibacter]NRG41658.1 hypothetical protein [Rathayibacter sp. VKM Ac-2835]QHF25180.1 hypothetical protein GTU73_14995 [Rathayibacter sp. VKM Ac-2804]